MLNPLNVRLAPAEIGYILGHAGSRVVFYHADFEPMVTALRPSLAERGAMGADGGPGRRVRGAAGGRLGGLRARRRSTRTPWPSSSTPPAPPGRPKGVVLTHRNLHLHAIYAALVLRMTDADTILHVVPALPRQRLGRAALDDAGRRPPRHAPQVRPRRAAAPCWRRNGSPTCWACPPSSTRSSTTPTTPRATCPR